MEKLEKIVELLKSPKQSDGNDYKLDLRISYSNGGVKVNLTDGFGGHAYMKKQKNLTSALKLVFEMKLDIAQSKLENYDKDVEYAINNKWAKGYTAENRIQEIKNRNKEIKNIFIPIYMECIKIL